MIGIVNCFLLFAVLGTPVGMWWHYYRNRDGVVR